MNDRYKEIFVKMSKRLDLVATGALLLLLIIVGYLLLSEQGSLLEDPPAPQRNQWAVKLPDPASTAEPSAHFVDAQASILSVNPDINSDPKARRLIQNPLFVMRSAAEQAEFQEEMNRLYNQADRLFAAGQHEEARTIVNNILSQDPNNRNARVLQQRLDSLLQDGTAATPSPVP